MIIELQRMPGPGGGLKLMACPVDDCDWGSSIFNGGDKASEILGLLLGLIDHLREDHDAMYPWEDEPGQDQRVTFQLEPARVKRLLEVLRSAGAHPSGLGSYEAANDANALADDLENMAERS